MLRVLCDAGAVGMNVWRLRQALVWALGWACLGAAVAAALFG